MRWYTVKTPDKKRPVAILSRRSVIEYLEEVTIALITTTTREISCEVDLSKSDGMPGECAINCDHIQTLSKGKIGALVTALSLAKLEELRRSVRFALDL